MSIIEYAVFGFTFGLSYFCWQRLFNKALKLLEEKLSERTYYIVLSIMFVFFLGLTIYGFVK